MNGLEELDELEGGREPRWFSYRGRVVILGRSGHVHLRNSSGVMEDYPDVRTAISAVDLDPEEYPSSLKQERLE